MSWKITFFNNKVEAETLVFPPGILANLLHILEMIEEFGPVLGKPHTAPMGDGLFEIRAKGKEGIGRALFCTLRGDCDFALLHQENSKDPEKGFGKGPRETEGITLMSRPTLESFTNKALENREVRESYEEMAPAYELRRKLVALRQDAGLTQEQIAVKLSTKKSNISRLESVNSTISPRLSTIADYAGAVGYDIKIDFVPKKAPEHNKSVQRTAQKRRR